MKREKYYSIDIYVNLKTQTSYVQSLVDVLTLRITFFENSSAVHVLVS